MENLISKSQFKVPVLLKYGSIIAIFLVMNISASSQTFYVSTTGLDSNPGTLDAPWLTIQKAMNTVTAGQTVLIRGGVYSQYLLMSNSGTPGNLISFLAFPGETPVIDGSSKIGVDVHLVKITGSYITLRGLEVQKSSAAGVAIFGGDHIILDSLHVHNCHGSGIGTETSFNTISNCTIHDVFDWASGGWNSDGIHFSAKGKNTPPYEDVGYNTVRNNLVYNCSDDGIDTWSSRGNIIEGNIVHHTGYSNAANGYTGALNQPAGDGNGYKCGGGGEAGQNIVINNVAYANRSSGFDGNSGIKNKFYNNTSYNNPVGFRSLLTDYEVVNNLSYKNPSAYNGSAPGVFHHNSWDIGITDPKFVSTDPISADFLHLASNSPAIDAGIDVGLPFSGSTPDLGAFDYGDKPTSIYVNNTIQNTTVYPNPFNGNCTIKIPSQTSLKNARMVIYDSLGKEVKSISIEEHEISVSMGELNKGIFFYQIINSDTKIGQGKLIMK